MKIFTNFNYYKKPKDISNLQKAKIKKIPMFLEINHSVHIQTFLNKSRV